MQDVVGRVERETDERIKNNVDVADNSTPSKPEETIPRLNIAQDEVLNVEN